jgi:hypothetical protein
MKLKIFTILIFIACLVTNTANANCYIFKNDTALRQHLDFIYDKDPEIPTINSLDLFPGITFPDEASWCPNAPVGDYATIKLTGSGIPSWGAHVKLGAGPLALPSQTLLISPPSGPAGNGPAYKIASLNRVPHVCPAGGTGGHTGKSDILRLHLMCEDGRKWSLTCESDGTRCSVSTKKFCAKISDWTSEDYCSHPGKANGWR